MTLTYARMCLPKGEGAKGIVSSTTKFRKFCYNYYALVTKRDVQFGPYNYQQFGLLHTKEPTEPYHSFGL